MQIQIKHDFLPEVGILTLRCVNFLANSKPGVLIWMLLITCFLITSVLFVLAYNLKWFQKVFRMGFVNLLGPRTIVSIVKRREGVGNPISVSRNLSAAKPFPSGGHSSIPHGLTLFYVLYC